MKLLFVILQFGASVSKPLSATQVFTFWGLILLFVALFIYFFIRTNKIIAAKDQSGEIASQKATNPEEVEEEIAAAIALAVHMYKNELHDQESFTITLKKVSRIYSPWSSKIYTLRQNPR